MVTLCLGKGFCFSAAAAADRLQASAPVLTLLSHSHPQYQETVIRSLSPKPHTPCPGATLFFHSFASNPTFNLPRNPYVIEDTFPVSFTVDHPSSSSLASESLRSVCASTVDSLPALWQTAKRLSMQDQSCGSVPRWRSRLPSLICLTTPMLVLCAFPTPPQCTCYMHTFIAKVHRWPQCFPVLIWAFCRLNLKASVYLPRRWKASRLRMRSLTPKFPLRDNHIKPSWPSLLAHT